MLHLTLLHFYWNADFDCKSIMHDIHRKTISKHSTKTLPLVLLQKEYCDNTYLKIKVKSSFIVIIITIIRLWVGTYCWGLFSTYPLLPVYQGYLLAGLIWLSILLTGLKKNSTIWTTIKIKYDFKVKCVWQLQCNFMSIRTLRNDW